MPFPPRIKFRFVLSISVPPGTYFNMTLIPSHQNNFRHPLSSAGFSETSTTLFYNHTKEFHIPDDNVHVHNGLNLKWRDPTQLYVFTPQQRWRNYGQSNRSHACNTGMTCDFRDTHTYHEDLNRYLLAIQTPLGTFNSLTLGSHTNMG